MNREIKFRAWDDLGKSWINWSNEMFKGINSPNEFFEMMDANGCPVQQFTGLKDKNGKEIYFGDLVHIFGKSSTMGGVDRVNQITDWNDVVADWSLENAIEAGLALEVIGNIYENPELLNEK